MAGNSEKPAQSQNAINSDKQTELLIPQMVKQKQNFWEGVVFLAILYLVIAFVCIAVVFFVAPPNGEIEYANFWTRVGIVLVADGVFINFIAARSNLNKQIAAAKNLEVQKKDILEAVEKRKKELAEDLEEKKEAIVKRVADYTKEITLDVEERKKELAEDLEGTKGEIVRRIEDYKKNILLAVEERRKELSQEIEAIKGQITRQNDFLKQTITVKSIAYEKMFIASNLYYRELQKLALGKYNENKIEDCEKSFLEAEALAANLDDRDIEIVEAIRQTIFNTTDSVEDLRETDPQPAEEELKRGYIKIWEEYAPNFGSLINQFRDRAIYRNKKID